MATINTNVSFAISLNTVDAYARFAVATCGGAAAEFLDNDAEGIIRAVVSTQEELIAAYNNAQLKIILSSLVDGPMPKAMSNAKLAAKIFEAMNTEMNTMEKLSLIPASVVDTSPVVEVPVSSPRIALDASDAVEMTTVDGFRIASEYGPDWNEVAEGLRNAVIPSPVDESVTEEEEGETEGEETEEESAVVPSPVATVPATPVETEESIKAEIASKHAAMGAAMTSGDMVTLTKLGNEVMALTKRMTQLNSAMEQAKAEEARKAKFEIAVSSLTTVAYAFAHEANWSKATGQVDLAHLEILAGEIAEHLRTIKGAATGKKVSATGTKSINPPAKGERNKRGESKAIILEECSKVNGANPKELGALLGYAVKDGKQTVCRVEAMEAIRKAGMVIVKVNVPGTQRVNIKAMTKEEIASFQGTVDEKSVFIPADGFTVPYVDAA